MAPPCRLIHDRLNDEPGGANHTDNKDEYTHTLETDPWSLVKRICPKGTNFQDYCVIVIVISPFYSLSLPFGPF